MKVKFLAVLCLAAAAALAGCGGDDKANANKTNLNAVNNGTATAPTTAPPAKDAAVQAAVEDAMKKKGFTEVQVDATTTEVTLRGTVPEGKMTEAVQAANEVAKRKVVNQLTEKK